MGRGWRPLFSAPRGLVVLVVVLGAILAGAAWTLSPTPRAYGFLLASRVLSALDELRNPVDLFDEPIDVDGGLAISHGVASGEVTAESAVIWARATRGAALRVRYDDDPAFGTAIETVQMIAAQETDYTARVQLQGLKPMTRYFYEVWFEATESGQSLQSPGQRGSFVTAPPVDGKESVSFVFSGDLGGAGYCRDLQDGYRIFDAMSGLAPRFFLAMGDMIYADDTCPVQGPRGGRNVAGGFRGVGRPERDWNDRAEIRDIYRRHWRYNRADPHFSDFLGQVPTYSIWDDHEVINDSGSSWDYWRTGTERWVGYPRLVREGREAFFNFAPMLRPTDDPDRIYRAVRWGADLELFLLDARSYRSRNDMIDARGAGKTILGATQLAWLKEALDRSNATWKVVVSSVPLSAPTGGVAADAFGRDGWASGDQGLASRTGFEQELLDLLAFLDDRRTRNLVFLTGDLHRPMVIRYDLDPNGDGDSLQFHEVVVGPLSATPRPGFEPSLDSTLRPQLLYEEGGLFNFGFVRVSRQADSLAHFLVDIRGEDGRPRPGSARDLVPWDAAAR